MVKYRKKPIIIEAYQTDKELDIETLEGTMHASIGDYIITGINGEQYPCKPDIFEKTYDPVNPQYDEDMPCNRKGCSYNTRRSCCGCPEQLEYERKKKQNENMN